MKRLNRKRWPALLGLGAMLTSQGAASVAFAQPGTPITPITHVVVLIGENHTFDNLYATYNGPQKVSNLLSRGIINANGTPGPNAALATQNQVDTPLPSTYFISVPAGKKTPYSVLPPPNTSYAPGAVTSLAEIDANPTGVTPPFDNSVTFQDLEEIEPNIPTSRLFLLRTGQTGLPNYSTDTRVPNATSLPNTVFQWTSSTLPYDAYIGDQVHRLFHMWQQSDCNVAKATPGNPSGCQNDLYSYVGVARDDGSGSNSMGFINMQNGDAPYLRQLSQLYTISDNYHQGIMGGTAVNHQMLGTADDVYWTTFDGLTVPPANIANPNPSSSTSDKYVGDGDWANCSDTTQPGIQPIVSYLATLPYHPSPNCAAGTYYMVNNMSPGYLPNGTIDSASIDAGTKVPPSPLRTIGDELNENNISWAYYGGGYNAAVAVANGSTDPLTQMIGSYYCDICNFESYASSIMGDPTQMAAHIQDAQNWFTAVANGTLPAVSFVKPDAFTDGHPASSKTDLFEALANKMITALTAANMLSNTVLFITVDEGGGSWDSGYIQPLDFFGDGPRIPLIAVSQYTKGGHVSHAYADHASILKFIERNWALPPLTARSRDNLPNPVADSSNPYVPTNSPAISDLFDMFTFPS